MHFSAMKNRQSGQVLLVVVLAAVVSLTVGLAAVSRTITNTRVASEESNTQEAMAAAEAGIEEQIQKTKRASEADGEISVYSRDFSNSSSVTATSEPETPTRNVIFPVNDEAEIDQDEGADVWFSDLKFTTPMNVSPGLIVYWVGGSNCGTEPAIEIVVISGAKNAPALNRYAIDRCSRGNGFSSTTNLPEQVVNGVRYNRAYRIPDGFNSAWIARIIPLYHSTKIAIRSNDVLPSQGYSINSTGTSGGTVRKVKVFQSYPSLPIEFFPYNLFIPNP